MQPTRLDWSVPRLGQAKREAPLLDTLSILTARGLSNDWHCRDQPGWRNLPEPPPRLDAAVAPATGPPSHACEQQCVLKGLSLHISQLTGLQSLIDAGGVRDGEVGALCKLATAWQAICSLNNREVDLSHHLKLRYLQPSTARARLLCKLTQLTLLRLCSWKAWQFSRLADRVRRGCSPRLCANAGTATPEVELVLERVYLVVVGGTHRVHDRQTNAHRQRPAADTTRTLEPRTTSLYTPFAVAVARTCLDSRRSSFWRANHAA
jgi:hypothetical protein